MRAYNFRPHHVLWKTWPCRLPPRNVTPFNSYPLFQFLLVWRQILPSFRKTHLEVIFNQFHSIRIRVKEIKVAVSGNIKCTHHAVWKIRNIDSLFLFRNFILRNYEISLFPEAKPSLISKKSLSFGNAPNLALIADSIGGRIIHSSCWKTFCSTS